jgi:hypothetical protein
MKRAFTFTSALVLMAAVAGADLTVVSKVSAGKGEGSTQTQYISTGKLRTSDPQNDTIFDYETGKIVFIDNKKKEYYETTVEEMSAMFAELEEQMKAMPLGMGKMGEVTFEKLKDVKAIAGYDCEHYVLTMGDQMTFDVWAAPKLEAPHQYFEARKVGYAAMGPMGRRFERMFEQMKKVKGFPLSVNTKAKMMMMKIDTLSEATEVKTDPIAPSVFDLPKGYKQKDSPFKKKK